MITETIKISEKAFLKTYLWDFSEELSIMARQAVLIFPGGAYMMCSDREAEPIALAYMAEGYQTFVLRYTTEADFTPAFEEAQAALDLIREHATEWRVIPDKIAVCGFSAGGHLACAMGIMALRKPNAMILGYPAVIGDFWLPLTPNVPDLVSRVKEDAVPCFIASCCDDNVVPVINSIELSKKLNECRIPFESHIFRGGGHGFARATWVSSSGQKEMENPVVAQWLPLSVTWLQAVMGSAELKEERTLPENLAPAVYRPILELTGRADTNAVLLKYSEAFASRQMLAMARDNPVASVLIPFGLSNEQMLTLSQELQAILEKD